MNEIAREYPTRPIVGVGAVILQDDRVLLVKRGRPPRLSEWSLPGGAQETGEPLLTALRREVKEETNLDISVQGLIDVVDGIFEDDDKQVKYHYTIIDYLAHPQSDVCVAGDDVREVRWIPCTDIEQIEMWSETKRIIAQALELDRG